jgi:predicted O-methyltransferase YrrM
MDFVSRLRSRIKHARKRRAEWVRAFDAVRLFVTSEGRWQLWTSVTRNAEVHQTTPYTTEDRYPELFELAAKLSPNAKRILSFGCSTGEELVALRRRFREAEIVGAEINPRSRRIATRRVRRDVHATVVRPEAIAGSFDIVFVLAVLQREPHKIAEMDVDDLSAHYPFQRFDQAVSQLVARLQTGGLFCVTNAHYPVEVATAFAELEAIAGAPSMGPPLFGRDGRRLSRPVARTVFRKRA